MPWRVWTGTGWEKHEGGEDANSVPNSSGADIEEGLGAKDNGAKDVHQCDDAFPPQSENASTSLPTTPPENQPWFESQVECAICLCEFAKGDKVRVLPCHHIFHLHEVDEWLIQRKKLVPSSRTYLYLLLTLFCSVLFVKPTLLNLRRRRLLIHTTLLRLTHLSPFNPPLQLMRRNEPPSFLLILKNSTIDPHDLNAYDSVCVLCRCN